LNQTRVALLRGINVGRAKRVATVVLHERQPEPLLVELASAIRIGRRNESERREGMPPPPARLRQVPDGNTLSIAQMAKKAGGG
jgi:hypothetical protein